MLTAYARALRAVTLDALSIESQRVTDRLQSAITESTADTRELARIFVAATDLLTINAELMRRLAAKEGK